MTGKVKHSAKWDLAVRSSEDLVKMLQDGIDNNTVIEAAKELRVLIEKLEYEYR